MKISLNLCKKIFSNKIVLYMLTRYIVYFVQFIVSILCATKMGPYYYGLWGFILLCIGYFARVNFGIPTSVTVLLVKHKENKELTNTIQSSSIVLNMIISCLVVLIGVYQNIFGFNFIKKYPIGNLFYVVCFIAITAYFIQLFTNIYRVKGKLLQITISQSIIPILLLACLFLGSGEALLYYFTFANLVGNIIAFCIFIAGKQITFTKPSLNSAKLILKTGIFLFIYNCCFYLIILSTRTVVSSYYPVDIFGYFTFAYALADAVILLLDAFSYLIFPKLIDKLKSDSDIQVKNTLSLLRSNYISLCHLLMYAAFFVFPVFTYFMPQYHGALKSMYLIALTLLIYTNSYGYSTYLMAQGKEKLLSNISVISLIINICICLLFAGVFKLSFEYVILATMISYYLFSLLCVLFGRQHMEIAFELFDLLQECFPVKLFVPFFVALIIVLMNLKYLIFIPLILFLIFNHSTIKEIFFSFKKVLLNPSVVDVQGVK